MNGTESRIWEPQLECMDRAELEQLQLERLEATLNRVYRHVPFYRKRFDEIGFNPDDFRSVADLARLPFTEKDELSRSQAEQPPLGAHAALPIAIYFESELLLDPLFTLLLQLAVWRLLIWMESERQIDLFQAGLAFGLASAGSGHVQSSSCEPLEASPPHAKFDPGIALVRIPAAAGSSLHSAG